jgi:hypothetical protein
MHRPSSMSDKLMLIPAVRLGLWSTVRDQCGWGWGQQCAISAVGVAFLKGRPRRHRLRRLLAPCQVDQGQPPHLGRAICVGLLDGEEEDRVGSRTRGVHCGVGDVAVLLPLSDQLGDVFLRADPLGLGLQCDYSAITVRLQCLGLRLTVAIVRVYLSIPST